MVAGNRYTPETTLTCIPINARNGVVVVLQSITSGTGVNARNIIGQTLKLGTTSTPYKSTTGAPITNYRPAFKDLAVKFQNPVGLFKAGSTVTVRGSYHSGTKTACLVSNPLKICAK